MLISVGALAPGGYDFGARSAHWRPTRCPSLQCAQKVEPVINAFTYDRYEAAMSAALAAEEAYGRGDDSLGPLAGIPVALKNETNMKGENTIQGSLLLKDNIDDTTLLRPGLLRGPYRGAREHEARG